MGGLEKQQLEDGENGDRDSNTGCSGAAKGNGLCPTRLLLFISKSPARKAFSGGGPTATQTASETPFAPCR